MSSKPDFRVKLFGDDVTKQILAASIINMYKDEYGDNNIHAWISNGYVNISVKNC
jgi:hypothetical protein